MLSSDLRSVYESYQNIYEEGDGISCEMIEEIVEELIEECVEYGYTLDEAADTVEEAATEYLMELNPYAPAGSKEARAYQKSTTSTKRGEARKAAVKGAVERVKAKAKGAKAAAGIAGSIAKDEARRAGRAAKQAVTSTAQKTKEKVKSGVKGLLGKGLRAAAGAAGSVAQKARKAGAAAGRAAERLGEEVIDEAYKELPTDKMRGKVIQHAASGTKRAFLSKLKGQKGTTAGNVEDAKAMKSLNKAKKIQGEIKNREQMGSDFYQGSREGRALANKRRGRMKEGYDIFDVILEHLVAEGYADTNENALVIMANMSEEWREEILEGSYEDRIAANNKKYDRNRQRAAQRAAARNAARDAGKTGAVPGVGYVTPRRESETYRDSSGTERHKSGAKMPKNDK
jgi:hypothetical protein